MAKQIGFVKVRGTIGGITFYKLNGGYYARKKSSLSKERVLRDAAFAGSRRSSSLFGTASKLAKIVYRRMPIKKKGHGVIGKLTAKANGLLHEGIVAADALELLLEKYVGASAQMMLERAVQGKAVTMFHIEHSTSSVLEENHYYPFGLTISGQAGGNTTGQPYKYQGMELEKHFGFGDL